MANREPETTGVAPKGCTHLKLKQASRLVARHYEAFVAPTGLRNMQYSLLSHVVKLGPLRAGELAAAMRLDASTLSRNMQPLIERGLLRLEPDSNDARSKVVSVTPGGEALRAEAQRAWKRAQLALNQKLGPARVVALHGLIDECMTLLEDEGVDGGQDHE